MEPSKTQKQIISLGEQLVDSLGKAYDVGPVARWMSHYIAEQMTLAETTTGEARLAAQQRCFDTILKLWSQRATIPGSGRPFRSFQPIFDVLERLDLGTPSFYHMRSGRSSDEPDGDVAKIVQLVASVDETARTLIRTFLAVAVALCNDEATLGYLKAAQDDMQSADTKVVFRMLSDFYSEGGSTDKQERDKEHIETLDRFVEIARGVRKMLVSGAPKASKETAKTKPRRRKVRSQSDH